MKILAFSHNEQEELRVSKEEGARRNYIEQSQLLPCSVLDPPYQDISSHLTAVETVAS